jgi:putative Holliday junction resolvase
MSDTSFGSQPVGRIAAIDFGTVRMGIAITDPQQKIASPLDLYHCQGKEQDASYFCRLATDEQIVLWVVGLPVHLSGSESQKSIEARKFGAWLETATGIPVTYFDERFTTQFADDLLRESALTNKKRKQRRDKIAAQIILSSFLESDLGAEGAPLPLEDAKGDEV